MLVEIKSNIFRNNVINFHNGLNIILGDVNSSNSIGKSNLLLIIDFCFGGDTYVNHSIDVIDELNHHSFYFTFLFDDEKLVFKRSTDDTQTVYVCNLKYEVIKSISIEEFTHTIQLKYNINYQNTTFRSLVSPFIRIWGKDNYDMKKPLKTYKNDSKEIIGIENLIKLFNEFSELEIINESIKKDEDSKKTINGMYRNELSQQITKSQFKKNESTIELIKSEIEDIKENILKYVVNVDELINKNVLQIKKKKDELLTKKSNYENQLYRIEKNLELKSKVSKKQIDTLQIFFPNSNIKKIEKIEEFHSKLKNILSKEIKERQNYLKDKISLLADEISVLDTEMEVYIDNKNPKTIIEKVYELTIKLNEIQNTNHLYTKKEDILSEIKTLKEKKETILKTIIDKLSIEINDKISIISNSIYTNTNPPKFELNTNGYELHKPKDKGTGSSYMNLLIFDLSIFELTNLPILIHDSLLFDNISITNVEKLIQYYDKCSKQIFISIDGQNKYSHLTEIFQTKKVIELDGENVLFIKKWNKIKEDK